MTNSKMAIIGMGFHVGGYDSVESFMKGLIVSKKAFKSGLKGAEGMIFDRDILVEKAMGEALLDAELTTEEKSEAAFIWHYASSPLEKSFGVGGRAAEVAKHFGLGQLTYTIYDGENSIFRGLALANSMIAEKATPLVAICVTPPLAISLARGGSKEVEGAVVFLLKDEARAISDGNKIYAGLSGLTIIEDMHPQGMPSCLDNLTKRFLSTLDDAGVVAGEVRVVEVPKGEALGYRNVVKEVCNEGISDYLVKENFLLGETESFIGDSLEISTAVSFVKHALQLFFYHVFIFQSESTEGVSFFVDKDPALWNYHVGCRTTLITSVSEGKECAKTSLDGGYIGVAVLTDCVDTRESDTRLRTKEGLLPIACHDPEELCFFLQALKELIAEKGHREDNTHSLKEFCEEVWLAYKEVEEPSYTLVLLFDSVDALAEEVQLILDKKEDFTKDMEFNSDFRYTSKRGSHFTANPHGKDAKVVYMNPPGSAQHMLLFYEMLTLFPRYRNVYSTVMNGTFATKMNEMDYRFGRFGMELLMIGIVDRIAKDRFGLSPDILTGASLGEIATLFAYDCMEKDLQSMDSPELMSLLEAFRDTYGVVPFDLSVKYIKADIERIQKKADEMEDVYILVYASPYGAFMSGKPEAMERFVRKNNFISWELDLNSAIHTPHVEKFYDIVYQANMACDTKFRNDLEIEIYSTYTKEPVENTLEKISEFVAAILIKPCDFHGLLEVLYERGGRVFIDMSTGGTCLAWAEETFAKRDALCFSIYPSFMDSRGSLLKTFAKLLSNHIKINLDIFLDSFDFLWEDEDRELTLMEDVTPNRGAFKSWPKVSNLISKTDVTEEQVIDQEEINLREVEGTQGLTIEEFVNLNSLAAYQMYLKHENYMLRRFLKIAKGQRDVNEGAKQTIKRGCIWDYDDIVEITNGSPSKVWGERYAPLDSYEKRARLPLPPFMFVDRVVGIDAEFGEFRPSSIDVEYDITQECILRLSDSKVSILLLTEASQTAILLLSYIGIDIMYGGVSYRILNSGTELYSDFPIKGETICSRLEFLEFIQSGTITLVKSKYTSHVDGKLLMKIDVLGGFFTEEDLKAKGMGLLPLKKPDPASLIGRPALVKMKPREELLTNLQMFYDGDYDVFFYRKRHEMEIEKLYIEPEIRMIDRIISIDFQGGDYGLGLVKGEKKITKDHWSFRVHFKNDPVFPGSLLVEGASHLQMMYALNAGYANPNETYILSFEQNRAIIATFRGQVRQMDSTVGFVLQLKEIVELENGVKLVSDCDVIWQDTIVARVEELSVILEQKSKRSQMKNEYEWKDNK